MNKKVAIIGGGAAGMMVAATVVEQNSELQVHVFERNDSLGKKVILSGGGRCNLTTGIRNIAELQTKYPRGAKWLGHALFVFGPKQIWEWFESHRVSLKEEADKRVFPVSDDGHDVVRVFEDVFSDAPNVEQRFGLSVTGIKKSGQGFELEIKNSPSEKFDVVVITTGGNAYAETGSTGDGYTFAKAMGHSITKLGPSLSSFLVVEDWAKELSGISFSKGGVSAEKEDGTKVQTEGGWLFTHFGVSGPAVFALAAHLAFETIDPSNPLKINLILDSSKDNVKLWDKRLANDFNALGKKELKTVLADYMPQRLVPVLCKCTKLSETKKAAEIGKGDRIVLAEMLGGGIPVTVSTRRPGDEFVTAGGVETDEVESSTGESKLVPNLYFAGEVLNVDGITGGFNLTSSWAVGRLVGLAILKK